MVQVQYTGRTLTHVAAPIKAVAASTISTATAKIMVARWAYFMPQKPKLAYLEILGHF